MDEWKTGKYKDVCRVIDKERYPNYTDRDRLKEQLTIPSKHINKRKYPRMSLPFGQN